MFVAHPTNHPGRNLVKRSLFTLAASAVATATVALGIVAGAGPAAATNVVNGMDMSHYQGSIDYATQYSHGARFVYVKATEGVSYTDSAFAANYNGSYRAGFVRGAYHFARPNKSSGSAQADYFIGHGGGWSRDGRTLPGAVDLEYNPYSGGTCYGRTNASMAAWIRDFSNRYHYREHVYPVIYTSTSWWSLCVGTAGSFGTTNPLWVARYSSSVGPLPHGWSYYTFWQSADSGRYPGDQDRFNGGYAQLKAIANG
jgi:GH25 family lysozyme M1 (1,4-beta-N-acetylmuramidase)